MIPPMDTSKYTYKIMFDYPHAKFSYTMTDLTSDAMFDFVKQFGHNCPNITIKKVEQVAKRLRKSS